MLTNVQNKVLSYVVMTVFILTLISFTGVMTENVYAAVSAFSIIEAENYSSQNGANIQKVNVNPNGYALGYISQGDYIAYNNIDFGYSGVSYFRAKVATQYDVRIEIRSGSSNGTLLGTLNVSPTGSDFNTYKELSCWINNITGIQNIYLVFSGPINIDWFTFDKGSDTNKIGDVNCDGKVNSTDITVLKRHLLKIAPLTGENLSNADTNGDGNVTSTDLTLLMRYILKIIDTFPI